VSPARSLQRALFLQQLPHPLFFFLKYHMLILRFTGQAWWAAAVSTSVRHQNSQALLYLVTSLLIQHLSNMCKGTEAGASSRGCWQGPPAHQMTDLRRVAPEAGAAEGDPRLVFTRSGRWGRELGLVGSYPPSDGGAPRLVGSAGVGALLGVWDTGTGAFLGALQGSEPGHESTSLLTYQRASDGRPRVAAGFDRGRLCIWDGDDFQLLHTVLTNPDQHCVKRLAVYEEPTGGRSSTHRVSRCS
jgi:hypothetical protein